MNSGNQLLNALSVLNNDANTTHILDSCDNVSDILRKTNHSLGSAWNSICVELGRFFKVTDKILNGVYQLTSTFAKDTVENEEMATAGANDFFDIVDPVNLGDVWRKYEVGGED